MNNENKKKCITRKILDVITTSKSIWVPVLLGMVVLLASVVFKLVYMTNEHGIGREIVYEFLCTLSIAVIVVGVSNAILTLSSFTEYIKKHLMEILISDNYLKELSIEKQKELRNKLQKHIHSYVDLDGDGFFKFVQDEMDVLIPDYYYKEYVTHVYCKLIEGDKIKKTIKRRIVISKQRYGEITVNVSDFFCTWVHPKDSVILKKISIDGETKTRYYELKDELKDKLPRDLEIESPESNNLIDISSGEAEENAYSKQYSLVGDNLVLSENDITICIETETTVGIDDHLYIQRVMKPCKDFTVHINYPSEAIKVDCNAFGFMTKYKNNREIHVDEEGSSVIRFTNWIFPGDGIICNILKKEYFVTK